MGNETYKKFIQTVSKGITNQMLLITVVSVSIAVFFGSNYVLIAMSCLLILVSLNHSSNLLKITELLYDN